MDGADKKGQVRTKAEECLAMGDLDLTLGLLCCEILVGPYAAPETTKVA